MRNCSIFGYIVYFHFAIGFIERDLKSDAASIMEILEKAETLDERLTPLKVVCLFFSVVFIWC